MAIKLTTISRDFVPNVSFPTEEGNTVFNRELPPDEQVSCQLSLATIGQKTEYLGSYTVGNRNELISGTAKQFTVLQYEKCVRKHCKTVKGLEAFGITNGRTLVAHEPTPELNEIIQEIFFKVNGIHADDLLPDEEELTDDSGEFAPEK